MKAVFFGNRELGCVCLEELLGMEVSIPLVVTYPPDPNEAPGYRCLRDVAKAYGLAVTTPPDASGRPLLDWIRGLKPDAIFSFYYGHRIGKSLRAVPPLGAFNLHGALLPRWRGRAPVPFIILEGEKASGVTLHHMVDEMDAGDIVAQVRFPLAERETATTLYDKTVAASRVLLRQTIPLIAQGRAPRAHQDESKATVTPPLGPRREIDRSASVERFDRTVRAFARPYPGARTTFGEDTVILWEGMPGEGEGGIPIPVADGTYRVTWLGFPGKKEMEATAFLAKHPDAAKLLGVPRGPG